MGACMHAHTLKHTFTYTHINIGKHLCVRAFMHTQTHTHVLVHICIQTHVDMQNYNVPKMNKEPLKAFEQNIITIGILKQDFKNMNGSQK